MFPGSDSHKIIGILAKTSLGSLTGVALNVARLGELEIIGINTIDIILIRLRACSWAISKRVVSAKTIKIKTVKIPSRENVLSQKLDQPKINSDNEISNAATGTRIL